MNESRLSGPGLSKSRAAPLVRRRMVELWSTTEGELRALFDAADVVSEGAARVEGGQLVYYGSTSVLLVPPDPSMLRDLWRVLPFDPHVRLRALRIAHREASARAGGPLASLQAELGFVEEMSPSTLSRGRPAFAISVDVTAVVLERGARSLCSG
ncbi:hypothetical protein [Chondromyces crocatus]|uniref:Uncharacterized protein n=1 Tax=Chondromyces crocatus TaxID=52 RepID=A0A0K1EI05_CHOCO|nr:hypothetical protein [Chondromyces crocatus]AKT40501.1 uncharacterized protein CMC5_046560 [Chondromyces crocatus]